MLYGPCVTTMSVISIPKSKRKNNGLHKNPLLLSLNMPKELPIGLIIFHPGKLWLLTKPTIVKLLL
ncbi:hypothetical protein MJO29_007102 [Puccinia striiformis f. sp. tritici]|nr:hypothetical protein MJO29_007102 [Puccinia striiformis f. sp. tritici]